MTTPRPATPQEAGRSVALNLVRLWDLVDLLKTTLPPAASASEMLSYHIHKMADRARRAQSRVGRCAVQEGCGRENPDAVDHHPEPRLYPGLFNALMALVDLWRAAPPATYAAAADQLSTVLRSQEQLHLWCARALCPTCRQALLARLGGFTCPHCARTSFHPEDARERYCGACKRFVDDVQDLAAERRAADPTI